MKYTLQSSKYVFKNFIYLFPFAILPALFLAISTDEKLITSVIMNFVGGRNTGATCEEFGDYVMDTLKKL